MNGREIRSIWLVFGLAGAAGAATHDVPGTHATVTAALAAAAPGDTVVVAAGTYAPSTNGETFPLVVTQDDLVVLGAGMGLSVLDAEGTGRVVTWSAASGGRLAGFTLRGGTHDRGGGLFVEEGDPAIDGNLVTGNSAKLRGAGILVLKQEAPATTPWIHHNVVWDNHDSDLGDTQDPHGVNYAGEAFGVFEHNLVGRTDGNGLITGDPSQPTVRHNIFLENGMAGPPPRGRGICWLSVTPAIVTHNLFHANELAAILWPVSGGNFSGVAANEVDPADDVYGNLDGDPLLADPDALDFHLTPGSPAIDAGDPGLPGDPDGTVADLGPFFLDQDALASPIVGARRDGIVLAGAPNPFRERTAVRLSLERESVISLRVVDVAGRVVRRLHDGAAPAGTREIAWDGRDEAGRPVAAGVYLVIVRTAEGARSLPVVRLR